MYQKLSSYIIYQTIRDKQFLTQWKLFEFHPDEFNLFNASGSNMPPVHRILNNGMGLYWEYYLYYQQSYLDKYNWELEDKVWKQQFDKMLVKYNLFDEYNNFWKKSKENSEKILKELKIHDS